MAAPMPIRTELFRFMSFKSPQLAQRATRHLWYVSHPAPGKSYFLKGTEDQSLEAARRTVASRASTFKSVGDKETIIALDPALYDFSQWLFAQRGSAASDYALARIDAAKPLAESVELTLWDELFAQLVRRERPTLRQACAQMLITSHIVRVLQRPNRKALANEVITTPRLPAPPSPEARLEGLVQRLARSKLLIPPCFSHARKATAPDKSHDREAGDRSTRDPLPERWAVDALHNDHRIGVGRDRLARLEGVETELTRARRDGAVARDDVSLGRRAAPAIAEAPLSATLRRFLDQPDLRGANLRKARLALGARMTAESARIPKVRGAADRDAIPANTYVITHDQAHDGGGVELAMTLQAGYDDAFVKDARYTLTGPRGQKVEGTRVREIATGPRRQLTLQLFPDQAVSLAGDDQYRVDGQFTLDRGQVVTFGTESALSKDRATGVARAEPVDPGLPGTPAPMPGPGEPVDGGSETEPPPSTTPLYGVNRLGIGVFRKVEQDVCCYLPGEVSHIENILAREYKERHTRSLTTSETTTEDTVSVETEHQTDTSTALRNELASEVANVLSAETTAGVNVNTEATGSYFGMEFSAGTAFDYGMSNGSTSSNADSRVYAEEVTRSALDRVVQNQTSKRTSRMLQEYEENNRHGFDNRKGDKHVTGVYRWIDILYRNRLINYGKHLMLEFLVPDPAAFYRKAMRPPKADTGESNDDSGGAPTPPPTLRDEGITDPTKITRTNYSGYARTFDAQLETPQPEEGAPVSLDLRPADSMGGQEGPKGNKNESFSFRLMLPFGYQLAAADFTAHFQYHKYTPNEMGTYLRATLCGQSVKREDNLDSTGITNKQWADLEFDKSYEGTSFTQQITLELEMTNVHDFSVYGALETEWSDYEYAAWQERCYAALQAAYDLQYDQYERDLAAWEAEQAATAAAPAEEDEEPEYGGSASTNRDLEKQELKRNAIEMLMRPYGLTIGQDFLEPGGCRVPSVRQDEGWEVYSSHVKFFEQSFEWGAMAYIFYPYYWADRCAWAELLQTEAVSDPLFTSFLRSGMARVVVPVRRGFADAITYYLDTGDIWLGGDLVLETDDELYLSAADELQELEGFVEDEWETRVPTSLTIVQGDSVYLADQGLPCCDLIETTGVATGLESSTALLEGIPRAQ
jgi:hypothetical protein